MDNNTNEINGANKKLIVPFIAISLVMVLLIAGGVSYAYFTWWGTAPGNFQEQATGTYPGKCDRACTVSSSACELKILPLSGTMGSGVVNSTTPKFDAKCPPVVEQVSIII